MIHMQAMQMHPLTKKDFLKEQSLTLHSFIAEKLKEHNLEYLMEISDEAAGFMKGFMITDICWVQNYHWGNNANFAMRVEYQEKLYTIEGANRCYAFPLDAEKSYVFFHSARTDEIFGKFLYEFGLEDLLIMMDGHNWNPSIMEKCY